MPNNLHNTNENKPSSPGICTKHVLEYNDINIMGRIGTSYLMMIMIWDTNISSRPSKLGWVGWAQKTYIEEEKNVERNNYILNTLTTEYN